MVNTDNIDRFGHCVICHNNLLVKRIVDGVVVDMFSPLFDETKFILNNGSEMKVTICRKCKDTVDLNDYNTRNNIMAAVYKGWELEANMLVKDDKAIEWDEKFAHNYLNKMKELDIDCHSENMEKYSIQKRQMEILNKKVEIPEEREHVINSNS